MSADLMSLTTRLLETAVAALGERTGPCRPLKQTNDAIVNDVKRYRQRGMNWLRLWTQV